MKHLTKTSSVRLNMFNPKVGYARDTSKVKETIWYVCKIIFFLSAIPYPKRLKIILLRLFGAKVGSGVVIKPRVNIHMPWKLVIGDHVWIGEEAFLLNFETLTIGNNVCISQRTFLCGGNHNYKDPAMSYRNGPITLEDGCWVGACCFVGPGVTIGTDTVVSACSLVTKNLEPNGIYNGNPAVFQKHRWPKPFVLKNAQTHSPHRR